MARNICELRLHCPQLTCPRPQFTCTIEGEALEEDEEDIYLQQMTGTAAVLVQLKPPGVLIKNVCSSCACIAADACTRSLAARQLGHPTFLRGLTSVIVMISAGWHGDISTVEGLRKLRNELSAGAGKLCCPHC